MKHRRPRIGAVISMAGLVTMAVSLLAGPSLAEAPQDNSCNGAFGGSPLSSLAIITVPDDGAQVVPGQEIVVSATWNPADWQSLDKILDCVRIGSTIVIALSEQEKPTLNDGTFVDTFTIPTDTSPGSTVCVRTRLSGQPAGSNVSTQKGNDACFAVVAASVEGGSTTSTTVGSGGSTTSTTVGTGGSTTDPGGTGGSTTPETSGSGGTGGSNTATTPGGATTEVAGSQAQRPQDDGGVEVLGNLLERAEGAGAGDAAPTNLARTGSSTPVLLMLAGMTLLLGGLAIGLGAPSSRRMVTA